MKESVPPSRTSFTAADVLVYALLLALAAVPFFLYEKAPNFLSSDVFYVDLGNSLLHSHSYSVNFATERLQPPGLPVILASVCATLGCTHDILIRTMPVFLALGLVLSYEVIRRQRGRLIAAACCAVVAASPSIFPWVTTRLWPTFPYFFLSMVVLFLLPKVETAKKGWRAVTGVVLLSLSLTAAVMVDSIGLALTLAIFGCLVLSSFGDLETASLRLRRFLLVVLVALLAEGMWLHQGGNPKDWPLPGYPEGYLAQLKVKDGNYPELGYATSSDLLWRVKKNLKDSVLFLADTLLHRWINPSWTSPVMAGLLILSLCGLWNSLRRSDSQLCALYFIAYESVYLLWPWFSGVLRFALAVLPFAYLFLAEGVLGILKWSEDYPRRVGILFLPLSLVLTSIAAWKGWTAAVGHGLQEKISAVFWIACTAVSVRLIWKGSLTSWGPLARARSFFQSRYSLGRLSLRPAQVLVTAAVSYLVVTGVAAEIPMGHANQASGAEKFRSVPEIQAARWIESHTDLSAIIASSQSTLIYHYSGRRVIWFPPISDPKVLMTGIRQHHIQYVVVISRGSYYYLPAETVCFDLLEKAYPQAFCLAEANSQVKIYEVLPDSAASNKSD